MLKRNVQNLKNKEYLLIRIVKKRGWHFLLWCNSPCHLRPSWAFFMVAGSTVGAGCVFYLNNDGRGGEGDR